MVPDTNFSRKKTDELTEFVKIYKAKGLPFVKYENKEFTGGISKFLSDKEKEGLVKELELKDNDILCESPYGQKILVSPVDRGTVIPQTVDWKPELKLLNFVNKELWEEELIREISGITYYPIDLFRFKNRCDVLRSPQIKWLSKDLDIQWKRYTKTLYYYIKDNRLYIGLWNYELRMPENPIRLCEIDETFYKTLEG